MKVNRELDCGAITGKVILKKLHFEKFGLELQNIKNCSVLIHLFIYEICCFL